MKLFRLAAIVAALGLASTALIACGGDDNEDEDQITEAIEQAATTQDPANCTEVQTENFTQQTEGVNDAEKAVESCEESATEDDEAVAESVEVSEIEVDGDTATANVAFIGGFIDGQSLEIAFANEDDQWKLDELVEFTEFDRQAFVDTLVEGSEEEGADPACIERELEDVSDEQMQALFLENDESLFEEDLAPCFEGAGQAEDDSATEETETGTETEAGEETETGTETEETITEEGVTP